jgi:hypothetical protein
MMHTVEDNLFNPIEAIYLQKYISIILRLLYTPLSIDTLLLTTMGLLFLLQEKAGLQSNS